MKKNFFCAAILIYCLTYKPACAQIHRLSANINNQPDWGPIGYDHAEYYYMPGIDAYYDVTNHKYVYFENKAWVHAASLPPKYANFDLYHNYKAVVNKHNPWEHAAEVRATYLSYKNVYDQEPIRDSRDKRYLNHWKGK
jgi:hypothetical protein